MSIYDIQFTDQKPVFQCYTSEWNMCIWNYNCGVLCTRAYSLRTKTTVSTSQIKPLAGTIFSIKWNFSSSFFWSLARYSCFPVAFVSFLSCVCSHSYFPDLSGFIVSYTIPLQKASKTFCLMKYSTKHTNETRGKKKLVRKWYTILLRFYLNINF